MHCYRREYITAVLTEQELICCSSGARWNHLQIYNWTLDK